MIKTNSAKPKLNLKPDAQVALVYRSQTAAAVSLAKTLTLWLIDRGHQVYTAPNQKKIPGTKLLTPRSDMTKISLVIVLGGDGTYLRAVRLLRGQPVPILGVNLGSLGFLTPTRADQVFTNVEQTLKNKMELRARSMLSVTYHSKRKKRRLELLALNDVVIERGSLSQLINIEIQFNKKLVAAVKADGIIVSSPTGSTAYNLAAGGPILHPEARALVVTPIAAHSLTSRPTIFPDNKELSFRLVRKLQNSIFKDGVPNKFDPQEAHLVVDGQKVAEISAGDEVVVTRAALDHYLVKDPDRSFFGLLRDKLKFGDRE